VQVAPAWGADVEVVIAGLTNTYSSYITTWEEYQVCVRSRDHEDHAQIARSLSLLQIGQGITFGGNTTLLLLSVSRCSGTRAPRRCTGRTRWEPTSRSSAGACATPRHRGTPAKPWPPQNAAWQLLTVRIGVMPCHPRGLIEQ